MRSYLPYLCTFRAGATLAFIVYLCFVFPPWQIPSLSTPCNETPSMRAREICEAGQEALRSGKYDQIRINFAK